MNALNRYTGLLKLAALLIVLPATVYGLAVRRSVELGRTVRGQAVQIAAARMAPVSVAASEPSPPEETGRQVRTGALLHGLTRAMDDYGVTAERYTPLPLARQGGAELYAGELVLGGRFIALTRLLERIETRPPGGRLVSVRYMAVQEPRTRETQLQMTLVFQQITPDEP